MGKIKTRNEIEGWMSLIPKFLIALILITFPIWFLVQLYEVRTNSQSNDNSQISIDYIKENCNFYKKNRRICSMEM